MEYSFVLSEEMVTHTLCVVAADIIQKNPCKLALAKIFRLSREADPTLTGAAIVRLMGY